MSDWRAHIDGEPVERAKLHAEIRRRIEEDDAHPDRAISLDDAERSLLESHEE